MSNLGYAPKNLLFDEEGREKLYKGIAKISSAVKSTLGPEGQTVLIESNEHTRGMTVTKDGVTVAKAVSLLDPTENLAVNIMKEAADKTATQAGDGTTTAIVLTEALVNAGKDIDKNKTQILRELKEESNKIVESLKKKSTKVTNKKT
jgi:chaperonin GroEL